jgi:hypothetical protein
MTIEFLNYIYGEIINRSSDDIIGMQIGSGCYRSTLLLNVYKGQSDLDPLVPKLGYLDVNIFTDNIEEYDLINQNALKLLFGDDQVHWSSDKIGDIKLISVDKPEPICPVDSASNAYLVVIIDDCFLVGAANETLSTALDSVLFSISRVPDCRTINQNVVFNNMIIGKVQYGQYSDISTNLPKNSVSLVLDLGLPGRMLHMEEQMIIKNSLAYAANTIRRCSLRFDHGLHNPVFVTKKSLLPIHIEGNISCLKLSNIPENDRNMMEFSNFVLKSMSPQSKRWFASNNIQFSHDPEYVDHQQSFVDAFRLALLWKFGELTGNGASERLIVTQKEVFDVLDKNAFQHFVMPTSNEVVVDEKLDHASIIY